MPSLSDYQAFVAIVEAHSLSGAAKQLHRSVSAISKQLAKLENELSVTLVNRSTQSLAITQIGEQFYRDCKDILLAIEKAEQGLRKDKNVPEGKIVISMPEVLLRSALMDLLQQFSQRYPKVRFELRIENQLVDIIEAQVDFAFRMGELADSRLTAISMATARPLFCASPNYLAAAGKPKNYEQLLGDHCLLLPTYLNLSEQVRRFFEHSEKLPFSLAQAHTSNSEMALYQSVLRGAGIAVMLDLAVSEDLASGRLIRLFPHRNFPPLPLSLLFKNSLYMPARNAVFKDFVAKQAKTHFQHWPA